MGLALQSLAGVIAIPVMAWLLCESRADLPAARAARFALAGVAIQTAIALVLLGFPPARVIFEGLAAGVNAIQAATLTGMRFAFGYLAGGPAPFETKSPNAAFILGLQALPLILTMSVLSRLLYPWCILQVMVTGIAAVLTRTMGVSGPLGIAAAAKVFIGMIEAPLLIKPYLATLGRGELFALMTVGMATVAGTVFALYAAILEPIVPGAAGHVLTASFMNVIGALTLARLMVPAGYADTSVAAVAIQPRLDSATSSTMEAIAVGTADGLKLLAYVTAMLVVMVALVALANGVLGALTRPFGLDITFQKTLGIVAMPFALLIGIPWAEAGTAGSLLGLKVVLNELLAYIAMADLPAGALSPRSRTIMTYALCGFANLASLGIMVGGLSTMIPERRAEIAALSGRALLAGVLATLLTAAIVGVITPGP
jgi:concentrative nucleoside transporter, CNT family